MAVSFMTLWSLWAFLLLVLFLKSAFAHQAEVVFRRDIEQLVYAVAIIFGLQSWVWCFSFMECVVIHGFHLKRISVGNRRKITACSISKKETLSGFLSCFS